MRWIASVLLLASVAIGAVAQSLPIPEPLRAFIGKPAPKATLVDIDGKKHPLSDYRGKVLLLIYWAPH